MNDDDIMNDIVFCHEGNRVAAYDELGAPIYLFYGSSLECVNTANELNGLTPINKFIKVLKYRAYHARLEIDYEVQRRRATFEQEIAKEYKILQQRLDGMVSSAARENKAFMEYLLTHPDWNEQNKVFFVDPKKPSVGQELGRGFERL